VELCLKRNEEEFTVVTGMRLQNQVGQVGRRHHTYCRYPVTSSEVSAGLSVMKVDPKEHGKCCTIRVEGHTMPNALGEGSQNALPVVSGHGHSNPPSMPEPHGSKKPGQGGVRVSGGTPTPENSHPQDPGLHPQDPGPHPQDPGPHPQDPDPHPLSYDPRILKTGSGDPYMGHPGLNISLIHH
jgi:hypothetical protein